MLDGLTDLIELAKEYGPVTAAWVVFFVIVAWIMGKGAKIAFSNVSGLLNDSAKMRESAMKQLADAVEKGDAQAKQLADANAQAELLRGMLAEANDSLRRSREALIYSDARADNLQDQYNDLQQQHVSLQREMRDTLLALRIAQSPRPEQ